MPRCFLSEHYLELSGKVLKEDDRADQGDGGNDNRDDPYDDQLIGAERGQWHGVSAGRIEPEGGMKHPDGQFGVFLGDHAGDADFRSADQPDIDVFVRQ